jgi:hypothetical protein
MKTVIVIASLLLSSFSSAAQIPVRSDRSLRQQFDSYVELLSKELTMVKEKDKKKRFVFLSQTVNQMKSIRGEMESTDSDDAKHMDMMISSLEALPSKKEFKRKNCSQYQAGITDSETPAAEFLNTICN